MRERERKPKLIQISFTNDAVTICDNGTTFHRIENTFIWRIVQVHDWNWFAEKSNKNAQSRSIDQTELKRIVSAGKIVHCAIKFTRYLASMSFYVVYVTKTKTNIWNAKFVSYNAPYVQQPQCLRRSVCAWTTCDMNAIYGVTCRLIYVLWWRRSRIQPHMTDARKERWDCENIYESSIQCSDESQIFQSFFGM